MTEEEKPKYLEDLVRYQFGNMAARLVGEGDTPRARGVLEKLAETMGANPDLNDVFINPALSSKEGIEQTASIAAGKYQDALEKTDVTEFYGVRLGILTSILGEEEAVKAKDVFDKYKGQKAGEILKKMAQYNAIIKDETGLYEEKKKEETKKAMEKLMPIYTLISRIEQRNHEEQLNGATKKSYKEIFQEALKKA